MSDSAMKKPLINPNGTPALNSDGTPIVFDPADTSSIEACCCDHSGCGLDLVISCTGLAAGVRRYTLESAHWHSNGNPVDPNIRLSIQDVGGFYPAIHWIGDYVDLPGGSGNWYGGVWIMDVGVGGTCTRGPCYEGTGDLYCKLILDIPAGSEVESFYAEAEHEEVTANVCDDCILTCSPTPPIPTYSPDPTAWTLSILGAPTLADACMWFGGSVVRHLVRGTQEWWIAPAPAPLYGSWAYSDAIGSDPCGLQTASGYGWDLTSDVEVTATGPYVHPLVQMFTPPDVSFDADEEVTCP